jgi:outer membrane receptor for ferrienterochelin and colicin
MSRRRRWPVVVVMTLGVAAPSAWAQTDAAAAPAIVDDDDEAIDEDEDDFDDDFAAAPVISVSASRVETRGSGAQTTLDAGDIARRNARTLSDLLRQEAGIQVNAGVGGLSDDVMVDGLDGRHVLVLVNGRPLNGRVNQRLDLSRIPVNPESIEKIEVLRGAQSAVNGSDAIGAVIAITTRRVGAEPEASLRLDGAATSTGAPAATQLGLRAGGMVGPLLLSADGSVLRGFGVDRDDNGRADLPDRLTTSWRGEATTFVGDDHELRADALVQTQAAHTAVTGAPVVDATDTAQVGLGMHYGGSFGPRHTLDVDLRIDRYQHRALKLPGGGDDVIPPLCYVGAVAPWTPCPRAPRGLSDTVFSESRLEVTETARWLDADGLWPSLRTAVGMVLARDLAERVDDDGVDTLGGQARRLSPSAYAEAALAFFDGRAQISTGLRADGQLLEESGRFDGALSPKLGVVLVPVQGEVELSVRGSFARGFRAPSVQERFLFFDHSELGYVVAGNEGLTPERSSSVRLGVELARRAPRGVVHGLEARLSLDGFVNIMEDLIVEAPAGVTAAGVPLFSYENADRAGTGGLNVAGSVGTDVVRVDVSGQWLPFAQDSSACPVDDPFFCSAAAGARSLPLRPVFAVHAGLRFTPADGTEFYGRIDSLSERVVDEVTTAPAFVEVGLTLQQRLSSQLGVLFAVDNLLDQYDPDFGPRPGRVFRTSLVVEL